MIKILIRKYIKNYESTKEKDVREAYGVLAGTLGIICNLLLFGLKLGIGLFMNSIAIISDAFNNLSDTGSSVVAIIGAKMSNKLPDKEHPFGHGRVEYVSALIVSFLIIMVGIELFRNSLDKLLKPEKVLFDLRLIMILMASIIIKIWMYSYNLYIGKKISSPINKATAYDSLNDVIATSAVVLSTIAGYFLDFPIDGFMGLCVSVLIVYTGFSLAKDTVNILLGQSPDPEMVEDIKRIVLSSEYIKGAHDLIIHDYGPGRIISSIHVEISDQENIIKAHSVIDKIEKKVLKELNIDLVIHIDPI